MILCYSLLLFTVVVVVYDIYEFDFSISYNLIYSRKLLWWNNSREFVSHERILKTIYNRHSTPKLIEKLNHKTIPVLWSTLNKLRCRSLMGICRNIFSLLLSLICCSFFLTSGNSYFWFVTGTLKLISFC